MAHQALVTAKPSQYQVGRGRRALVAVVWAALHSAPRRSVVFRPNSGLSLAAQFGAGRPARARDGQLAGPAKAWWPTLRGVGTGPPDDPTLGAAQETAGRPANVQLWLAR